MLFFSVLHNVILFPQNKQFKTLFSLQGTHNYVKDVILISALLIAIAACLYAFIRHRKTQESMNIMLKELETLQQAEGDLAAVTGK